MTCDRRGDGAIVRGRARGRRRERGRGNLCRRTAVPEPTELDSNNQDSNTQELTQSRASVVPSSSCAAASSSRADQFLTSI